MENIVQIPTGVIVTPINNISIEEPIVMNIPPMSITPRQARLVLLDKGLLDDVEELVKTDRRISIYWEYATELVRTDAVLINLASTLGLSNEQLDNLFIEASQL
jgi:hypothetical protein